MKKFVVATTISVDNEGFRSNHRVIDASGLEAIYARAQCGFSREFDTEIEAIAEANLIIASHESLDNCIYSHLN